MDLASLVAAQRAYFRTGATLDLAFRRRALDTLEEALRAREGAPLDAAISARWASPAPSCPM